MSGRSGRSIRANPPRQEPPWVRFTLLGVERRGLAVSLTLASAALVLIGLVAGSVWLIASGAVATAAYALATRWTDRAGGWPRSASPLVPASVSSEQVLGGAALALVAAFFCSQFAIEGAGWPALLLPVVGGYVGLIVPARLPLATGVGGVLLPIWNRFASDIARFGMGSEGFVAFLMFGTVAAVLYAGGWAVGAALGRRR